MLLNLRSERTTARSPRSPVVAWLVLAMATASCTDAGRPGGGLDEVAERAVDGPTTTSEPLGPYDVPELETTPLGGEVADWEGMKASEGRLYAQESLDSGGRRLVRFDPETGEVLAETEVPVVEGWTVAPSAVVVLSTDRRFVTLLDPLTLEVTHELDLGEQARAGLTADTPRTDDFWLGLRRLDVDQLRGVYTDMAAVRLDLENGQIVERVEAPPCGASSVTRIGNHLVTGVVCAEQAATIELGTGEVQAYQSFPTGLSVLPVDDVAFLRWYDFGYLGRLRPGDDAIETLDLNADGPALSRITPQMAGPRGIWLAGTPVDEDLPHLLNVVDTESFTVVGRAWAPSPVAFIGDTGYAISEGRLSTFDPHSVTEGVPDEVIRPEPGPPPAVETTSADERAVVEAFTTVFDGTVPTEVAARNLVDDPETLELRDRLLKLAEELYPGVKARVTALAVGEDRASLAYVFLLDGRLVFVPLSGSLEFDGTNWRVTRDTVCRLAAQAAISEC